MQRYMHSSDVRDAARWPYIDMTGVETQFDGDGPWEIISGLTAIHTPGHSRGSVSYVANAALWLASDESGYTSGLTLTVDAGATTGSTAEPPAFAEYAPMVREAGRKGVD